MVGGEKRRQESILKEENEMKRKGLKSLDDLTFATGRNKSGDIITYVTNYGCGSCFRRLNLREGYTYYPQKQIILCAKCWRKLNPLPKKKRMRRYIEVE